MLYYIKNALQRGWYFLTNKKLKLKIFLIITLILVMLPQVCFAESYVAKPNKTPDHYSSSRPESLRADMLYATSAVAVDASTGRVLFSKDPDRKIYPASTTKVMTALLALEHLDMEETVTVSKNCLVGESSIYLEEGERITVRELLYGLLLKSGNDAGVALAEAVAGNVSDFAQMMNERAEELGCENTHFNNPHGLPDKQHYTSAGDYYKVFLEAMKHEEFMTIIGTHRYTLHVQKPDGTQREYAITNTNKMMPNAEGEFAYEYMLGGKTGFTNDAQSAFVSVSEKDGMRVVTVVFGSTTEGKWIDTRHLADYAFAAYSPLSISEVYAAAPLKVDVQGAADPLDASLELALANSDGNARASLLCSSSEARDIRENFFNYATVTYTGGQVTAPVQQGALVGQLHFSYEGMDEIVLNLTAARTVAASVAPEAPVATPVASSVSESGISVVTTDVSPEGWSPLYLLVIIPVVLFFILIVWLIMEIRRARQQKREMERARRTEEVKRRRAQREVEHLKASPLPRSQRPAPPPARQGYGAPRRNARPPRGKPRHER